MSRSDTVAIGAVATSVSRSMSAHTWARDGTLVRRSSINAMRSVRSSPA